MINLLESIDFYLEKGYEDAYATSKVAQDIILIIEIILQLKVE